MEEMTREQLEKELNETRESLQYYTKEYYEQRSKISALQKDRRTLMDAIALATEKIKELTEEIRLLK